MENGPTTAGQQTRCFLAMQAKQAFSSFHQSLLGFSGTTFCAEFSIGLVFLLKYKMAIGVGRREWRRRGSPFLLRRKQRHGPGFLPFVVST
jgi:hypothetical protein